LALNERALATLPRMKVHAEPKPLSGPLPGGKEGATVVVEPMRVGEAQVPPGMLEDGGGRLTNLRMLGIGTPRSRWWWVPCPAFLIRHPGAGPVLVDTGLHPSVAAKPAANLGRTVAAFARPRLDPEESLPAQLRARGIDPREVGLVVMTHLHVDHASARRSGTRRPPTRARCSAGTGRPTTTTSSTTGPSATTGAASPPTRASGGPSICSGTAACGSPSLPGTRPAINASSVASGSGTW
jgi:Metallo-beta-lactamase superfamily